MDDSIKSAAEIAMEKVKSIGEATEEERLKWKYLPEGEKLAAKYLKEDINLVAKLGEYDKNVRKYIAQGASDVLVRNIHLPLDEMSEKANKRAMEGLKTIKTDKVRVENIFNAMRRVFIHYQEQGKQQKLQTYEALKADFEAKVQQAMQQQMGTTAGMKIDVERQPQFQEEWRKLQYRIDSQYTKLVEEYKHELLAIL
jgi:hypothetical protein